VGGSLNRFSESYQNRLEVKERGEEIMKLNRGRVQAKGVRNNFQRLCEGGAGKETEHPTAGDAHWTLGRKKKYRKGIWEWEINRSVGQGTHWSCSGGGSLYPDRK